MDTTDVARRGVIDNGGMSSPDPLIAAVERFRQSYVASAVGPAPRRELAVLACMDTRLDLLGMLGLEVGDAHILRNAGGVITDDAIRSLVLSQRALGTRHTILVHHTDCGLQKVTEEGFLAELEQATGQRPAWRLGAFSDPFDDVRTSLQTLRNCPWLLSTSARGFVFDTRTGELLSVDDS